MISKKIFACIAVGVLFLSMNSIFHEEQFVYAASTQIINNAEDSSIVRPCSELTEWKYRIVDGKLQKRLWSLTYGKWLTKWQWV
ncbi:hypothetical protein [Anaerovorax odorimutans]|uniref:hypothetical protein n=1 Tax=Anaerovorax odorimutans TaxID=109327 RepID=UPI00040A6EB5|nr:hypothetical protein [Anaerovorax odorimutans]